MISFQSFHFRKQYGGEMMTIEANISLKFVIISLTFNLLTVYIMAEKRRYSKRLTEEETSKLIESRTKLNPKFIGKKYDRKAAWKAVSADAGINMDPDQLSKKWSNLLIIYKKLINPNTGSGTDNNELTPDNWNYFEAMHNFSRDRHNIYPPKLISSERMYSDSNLQRPNLASDNQSSFIGSEEEYLNNDSPLALSTESQNSLHCETPTSNLSPTPVSIASTGTSGEYCTESTKKRKIDEIIKEVGDINRKTSKRINKMLKGMKSIMTQRFEVLFSSSESDN